MFQSRPDFSMPVRMMGYVSLSYQALLASQPAAAWRKLPLVIPIVVYNGWEPWNVATDLGSLIGDLDASAERYRPQLRYLLVDESSFQREELEALRSPVADLFCIEKSRDWQDVRSGVHRLQQSVPPADESLRRAFETWLQRVILPRFGMNEEASAPLTLKELESMLAESIDRWNRKIREEGREKGQQEGEARLVLRLLRLKFGPLAPEVEEQVQAADADRLLVWGDRVLTAQRLSDVFAD
jgi:hypothetical protein